MLAVIDVVVMEVADGTPFVFATLKLSGNGNNHRSGEAFDN